MSIIGISGPARSGKDTLADLLIEVLKGNEVNCEKASFASQLKLETKDFLMQTLGIDSFTEVTEEKNIIRPFLVTWGTHVRRKLDPNVWIKSVEDNLNSDVVTIIADVRYRNEYDWVRSQPDSYCLFVDRMQENGEFTPPANSEEEIENEFLRKNCDFHLSWNTVGEDKKHMLLSVAFEVLNKTVPKEASQKWIQTYR